MPEAPDEFADLVPDLLASDRDAEERFYQLGYEKLMGWASRSFCIPDADCEDFALEVIEKIFARLDRYQRHKAKFTTWMFLVAQNHAYDRWRKRQGGKDPLHGAVTIDVLEWVESEEAAASSDEKTSNLDSGYMNLDRALGVLSENERRLLRFFYGTNLTSGEIANELNMKSNAVRKSKQRLLEKLRSLLVGDVIPSLGQQSSTHTNSLREEAGERLTI